MSSSDHRSNDIDNDVPFSDNGIPSMILIIGSGLFGLTTAYELCQRKEFDDTKIVVIDRLPFPAPDGASIDTSRIIRADYADPAYASLASTAQTLWRQEWGSSNRYNETGLILSGDQGHEAYMLKSLKNVQALTEPSNTSGQTKPVTVCPKYEDLARLSGTGGSAGDTGYFNPDAGWADAESCMRYLRQKVMSLNRMAFVTVPVARLLFSDDQSRCTGAEMEDGNFLTADLTILAAGAWTPTLLDLRGRVTATGQVLSYYELSNEEAQALSKIPTQLNISTGLFSIVPPAPDKLPKPASRHSKGPLYLKIGRHSYGYSNPTSIPNAEDPSSSPITVSVPHTNPAIPTGAQTIPKDGLEAARQFLHRIFPPSSPFAAIAERSVAFSRMCWYADTPTGDFLLDYHPTYGKSLFVATGGCGHAFKFLPVIGGRVVDCVMGKGPEEFRKKWAWKDKVEGVWDGDGSRGGVKGQILEEELMSGYKL